MKKPMLVVLNLDKKMRMEVNMLDYTTREVLSVKYKNRKLL